ncbi:MAG: peptidoglycan-binding protein [Actinobacteria bacterium]|nr:peptidoglycan-binding protein [Actinomycetota bacterium]MCI0543934.1 peptidoglycan-binding protein [Actinomycetota bacterium]MCI0678212.1 peptidoglycan-binding protein [Actinomycetota bacterium]
MRLYRHGDVGSAVRDIQARLEALGFESTPDLKGTFGEGTREAVTRFQTAKGIDVDGVVGPDTWRSLYEAGYRLGDRLVFLRRPMMRGGDIADLQSHLSSLGFDCGKVDGIFGPRTEAAIIDFQHNRGLAEDGRVGPEVITEMRLVTRGVLNNGRQAIREREWLRGLTPTLAGAKVFLDAGCRDTDEACQSWEAVSAAAQAIKEAGGLPLMSRSEDTRTTERVRAQRANRLGADVIVAFRVGGDVEDQVHYFASEHSRSEAGEELAAALAASIGGRVVGRAGVMLTETRAPAAVVAHRVLDEKLGLGVVEALDNFFRLVATRP